MIIDTSAILAILGDEPERKALIQCIIKASDKGLSAASFVETSIVLEARYGYDGVRDFDLFLTKAGITLIAVDVEQAQIARQAFKKYGKGRHIAGLNFGDCFSYAAAKSSNEPLLFKGNDFSQTDITVCKY
ncbi:MAG: type II toxin-antitoxin system VapC family toxin [Burkholderiales bacterium]|nr:type II toxin-antitoxin system VapC family toxin [Nitrosomonas sp.]MCP5275175.1 type II toxin-antitoxin system VapC family toxin [Burkholderiales bacterium]